MGLVQVKAPAAAVKLMTNTQTGKDKRGKVKCTLPVMIHNRKGFIIVTYFLL